MQVLQFLPGARAAAMAGTYTALHNDADVLFYNPAGIAALKTGASASYETQSLDIAFGSAAVFSHVGAMRIGASVSYLDAGSVAEIKPDVDFGGNIGTATGAIATASESAARLSIATTAANVRIGASAGFVSSSVASANSSAPFFDAGAQYDVRNTTIAAAIRNVGGSALPAEARVGLAQTARFAHRLAVTAVLDAVGRLHESAFTVNGGVEAGLIPSAGADISAVVRLGFDAEPNQASHLRFGAGLALKSLALDYAFQNMDLIGVVHRIGVRWMPR